MLYIMGDYVHTHSLTQLNTLSLHTRTDMHKPKQLNVCWSNTFCVNSSFLLPKQAAPLLLQHGQYGHSHCPTSADCGTDFMVRKYYNHRQQLITQANPSCVGPVVAECPCMWLCSGTKRPNVRPIYSCQNQLGFWVCGLPI